MRGLSNEVQQKLNAHRPETVGQAARISGITPAAISLLLVHLQRARASAPAAGTTRRAGMTHRRRAGAPPRCWPTACARSASRCRRRRGARSQAYVALLAKWNRAYNLTAIREPERMVTHHVLDALAVLPHLPQRDDLRVLDVGSGGGLPGIPLAIARPDWRVTLLDANSKKTAFLTQAAIELPARNVDVATRARRGRSPRRDRSTWSSRARSASSPTSSTAPRATSRRTACSPR